MERKVMPANWFMVLLISIFVLNYFIPLKKIIPFPFNHAGWILTSAGIALNLMGIYPDSGQYKQLTCLSLRIVTLSGFPFTNHYNLVTAQLF